MFTNNGAAKNSDKGKRKMTEFINPAVGKETRPFNVGSSGQHLDQVQRILNNTAPLIKPFSYMSLLTAPDDEDEDDDIKSLFKDTKLQIDHSISVHNENLKHSLEGALRDVQERAAKRVKAKEEEALERKAELERMVEHHKAKAERVAKRAKEDEERKAELERMVEHHKAKAERLQIRVRSLERTKVFLRRRLREEGSGGRRHYLEIEEEEGESSFQDPGRVGPITLECKVCKREMATMMLWPCRHVCVCRPCEAATRYCPVCTHITTTSIEVLLPLD